MSAEIGQMPLRMWRCISSAFCLSRRKIACKFDDNGVKDE